VLLEMWCDVSGSVRLVAFSWFYFSRFSCNSPPYTSWVASVVSCSSSLHTSTSWLAMTSLCRDSELRRRTTYGELHNSGTPYARSTSALDDWWMREHHGITGRWPSAGHAVPSLYRSGARSILGLSLASTLQVQRFCSELTELSGQELTSGAPGRWGGEGLRYCRRCFATPVTGRWKLARRMVRFTFIAHGRLVCPRRS